MTAGSATDMAQNGVDKSSLPPGVAGVPNEQALLALMERTGFGMIQENGQRKYGGPPPGWEEQPPPRGCEIFVGKIPRNCFEDTLVPIFEKCGKIYELRLMMDFSGSNRGYCFVMYTNKQDARRAVKELNNYEIQKGRLLGVCMSVDNCRLFVGGIPKNKHKEEILQEMEKVTEGVVDVIVYPSATDKTKNRGFAFVEYESHRAAAMARRKLIPGRIQLWGHQIAVDWAEPEQEVDEDVMSQVKILYVRNLMLSTTEETIEQAFNNAVGKENAVERVKKIRDYAFVHYRDRDDCLRAIKRMNGSQIDGSLIEVVLAKPVDKSDYVRYTRGGGGGVFPQSYPFNQFEQNPFGATYYGPPHFAPQVPGGRGMPLFQAGRGQPRMAAGIRPRGRGAAGTRGGGGRGYLAGYIHRGFRPKTEERLYDLMPGMELTPTNPITLKPQSSKSPVQILEEMCTKNGWGNPVYQLNSTVGKDGSGDVQLFLHKVTIPALGNQFPNGFQANKLCRSPDEAKQLAAEFILTTLGVPFEASSPDIAITAVVSPTLPNTTVYQARPLGPTLYPVSSGAPQELTFVSPSVPVISAALTHSPGEFPYEGYQHPPTYATTAHHYY